MSTQTPPARLLRRALPRCGRGFTLLELLIVVAVLALLAGLLLPALRATQGGSAKARELGAARQLMVAYSAYAYDHRGQLLPGFAETLNLPAHGASGEDLSGLESGQVAARYPWRLAPWLDYDLRGLILDRNVLEGIAQNQAYTDDFEIWLSLVPSLGINASFVGGDYDDSNNALTHPLMVQLFGRVYLARLSEARHPPRLIVFASARTSQAALNVGLPGGREILEGYFRVDAPYLAQRRWAQRYSPDLPPGLWGNVSLRHHHRQAVIGFLDGHTGTLDEAAIQDMRHWCDRADRPDWTLVPVP